MTAIIWTAGTGLRGGRLALTQAQRACTCHPDDRPDGPCRERYAASECQASTEPVKHKEVK